MSVVVVNYGTANLVYNLLESLRHHPDASLVHEVVVVDNGYPDRGDSRSHIEPNRYPYPVRFVQNESRSYSSGVNAGAAASDGPLIAISNSDVEWLPNESVEPLCAAIKRNDRIGAAGPQLLFPDGRWQRSHGPFPSLANGIGSLILLEIIGNGFAATHHRVFNRPGRPRNVDYIDGAFMLVHRSRFAELSGFDESFDLYAEDADFCWRARQRGWPSVFVPAARIMHIRGASSTSADYVRFTQRSLAAKRLFVARHHDSTSARRYGRIQRLATREVATLYRLIARLINSQLWRERAEAAAATAEAAAINPADDEGGNKHR